MTLSLTCPALCRTSARQRNVLPVAATALLESLARCQCRQRKSASGLACALMPAHTNATRVIFCLFWFSDKQVTLSMTKNRQHAGTRKPAKRSQKRKSCQGETTCVPGCRPLRPAVKAKRSLPMSATPSCPLPPQNCRRLQGRRPWKMLLFPAAFRARLAAAEAASPPPEALALCWCLRQNFPLQRIHTPSLRPIAHGLTHGLMHGRTHGLT